MRELSRLLNSCITITNKKIKLAMKNIFENIDKIIGYGFESEKTDFQQDKDVEVNNHHINYPETEFTKHQQEHIFYSFALVQKFVNSDFLNDFKNLTENLESDLEGDFQEVDKKSYYNFLIKYQNVL